MNFQETVIAGLVVILAGWLGKKILDAWSEITKDNMFSCCFTDHGPPGERDIYKYDFYPIPLGDTYHWVRVICNTGLPLAECHIRFITKEESVKGAGESPENIRSTIRAGDVVEVAPAERLLPHCDWVRVDDQLSGVIVKFTPPITLPKDKSTFFLLRVVANEVWSGKISFEGLDKDDHLRRARTDVMVVAEGVQAQTFKLVGTGSTPTTVNTVHTHSLPIR